MKRMLLLVATQYAVFMTSLFGATVITTREGLVAVADDLAGSYELRGDIDLGGAD